MTQVGGDAVIERVEQVLAGERARVA